MRSSRLFLAFTLMGVFLVPAFGEEAASIAPGRVERPIFAQTGTATYYGGRHVGHPTASGERLARHGLTAAHRSLPFGTVVRVTNLGNGSVVKVRINDRGPYVRKRAPRVLDLSTDAAAALGFAKCGIAKVRIEELVSDQRA